MKRFYGTRTWSFTGLADWYPCRITHLAIKVLSLFIILINRILTRYDLAFKKMPLSQNLNLIASATFSWLSFFVSNRETLKMFVVIYKMALFSICKSPLTYLNKAALLLFKLFSELKCILLISAWNGCFDILFSGLGWNLIRKFCNLIHCNTHCASLIMQRAKTTAILSGMRLLSARVCGTEIIP